MDLISTDMVERAVLDQLMIAEPSATQVSAPTPEPVKACSSFS
jgi:hypothetical protein